MREPLTIAAIGLGLALAGVLVGDLPIIFAVVLAIPLAFFLGDAFASHRAQQREFDHYLPEP